MVQALVGLIFLGFGYHIGKDRFLLILGGIKVQGKIVGYEEKLPGTGPIATRAIRRK